MTEDQYQISSVTMQALLSMHLDLTHSQQAQSNYWMQMELNENRPLTDKPLVATEKNAHLFRVICMLFKVYRNCWKDLDYCNAGSNLLDTLRADWDKKNLKHQE